MAKPAGSHALMLKTGICMIRIKKFAADQMKCLTNLMLLVGTQKIRETAITLWLYIEKYVIMRSKYIK